MDPSPKRSTCIFSEYLAQRACPKRACYFGCLKEGLEASLGSVGGIGAVMVLTLIFPKQLGLLAPRALLKDPGGRRIYLDPLSYT